MLAQGSLRYILPFVLVGLFLVFIYWWIGVPLLGFGLYLAWFFRDPYREIRSNGSHFLAAADGTVKYISSQNQTVKIAIRMSPLDVHLNRSPISGEVVSIKSQPGSHRSVYFSGAEDKNQRNLIVVENDYTRVEIMQITGSFARRIECWVEVGDDLVQGDKIGMIRFGSQTNVIIQSKQEGKEIRPNVQEGESVRAGITVLAKEEVRSDV